MVRKMGMEEIMETLGVITARGGSKRVPRKNVRKLAGKPLIEYTIDAACGSTTLNRIITSTDDPEIAFISKRNDVEVVARPLYLASDLASDIHVFQHVLKGLEVREGYKPDIIVHLRPTAPFLTSDHIDRAVELLLAHPKADSVRSVCPPKRGPYKLWVYDKQFQHIKPFNKHSGIIGAHSEPSQMHPEFTVWMQNGVVDAFRWNTVMKKNSMTGKRVVGMFMHEEESWCIDTEFEWRIAELLLCDELKE
jgi:N-acylneuraminate cytidylyltransferase